jgi:hypothetical protein
VAAAAREVHRPVRQRQQRSEGVVVPAARSLFRAITRKKLRNAGTVPDPDENVPGSARESSAARQGSAARPAILRDHERHPAPAREPSARQTAQTRDHAARRLTFTPKEPHPRSKTVVPATVTVRRCRCLARSWSARDPGAQPRQLKPI